MTNRALEKSKREPEGSFFGIKRQTYAKNINIKYECEGLCMEIKAVILAGGEGTRLRPITCKTPKPLSQVGLKPVLGHITELLTCNGISEAMLTLKTDAEKIKNYCEENETPQLKLSFMLEEKPMGTAGSVKGCESFLSDSFVVISGDTICNFDLKSAIDFHLKNNADATLLLYRVEEPLEYGVCLTDSEGRITQFIEKPSWERVYSDMINTGIYIMKKECLDLVPKDMPFDFGRDLFPTMLKLGKRLYGFESEGYWCDIGSLKAYLDCNIAYLDGRIKKPVTGLISELAGVKIIPPVMVGKGLTVGAGTVLGPYAVIGDSCTLGEGVRISRTVVGEGVKVGEGAFVTGAVVCKGGSVGAGAKLEEDVVLGENSIVGDGCEIKKGVKVWADKYVEDKLSVAGSVVFKSLSRGLFDEVGITGNFNEDFNPVFAAKLGGALGQTFEGGIIIGRSDPASGVLSSAVSAAARAMGAGVCNAGLCSNNVLRFTTAFSDLAAGVYLTTRANKVTAVVYEGDGLSAAGQTERKLAGIIMKEDNSWIDADDVSEETVLSDASRRYFNYASSLISGPVDMHISLKSESSLLLEDATVFLASKSATITRGGIEIELAADGERFTMSQDGRQYSYEQLLIVLLRNAASSNEHVYAPKDAPLWVLKKSGMSVERYGSGSRRGYCAIPYCFDNFFGAIKILSIMKNSGKTLRELTADLPSFAIVCDEVELGGGRAAVMDRIVRDFEGKKEQGTGISFITDTGEVQVIPLKTRGGFAVKAQAADVETAAELCLDFCTKIRKNSLNLDKQ